MNEFYRHFIENGRSLAAAKGLRWDPPSNLAGKIVKNERWDLAALCGLVSPPYYWLSSVGYDASAVAVLNGFCEELQLQAVKEKSMPVAWRDLYQALLLNELLVKRNKPGHAVLTVGRSLRILATCAGNEAPWEIGSDTVQRAYNVALGVGESGKLAANMGMLIRTTVDGLHLADKVPLAKYCTPYPTARPGVAHQQVNALKRRNNSYRQTTKTRQALSDRKCSTKLPGEKSFWELVRIVFTESPRTFADAIRFDQIKVAIACGFRVGENIMLPVDWARWREYVDGSGRPAGEKGGISRSLSVKHFAEKQAEDQGVEGIVLYENVQHAPAMFENLITDALTHAEKITQPLRERLRRQIETGRLLPEFSSDALVPAWDMYSRLSGAIRFAAPPLPDDLVAKYRQTYDPIYLDELREWQLRQLASHGVSSNCMKYWKKLPIAIRRSDGSPFVGTVDWQKAFVRVSEAENLARTHMVSKLPDTQSFLLHGGGRLSPAELMFLLPVRAIAEERNGGIVDINRYFAVGRASSADLHFHLGGNENNLFFRYGQTDEDRALTLNTHSLRHLQNAELFRLGVADTIITKRFNRRSVAQSYVYDHRSLAEDLAHIDLPAGTEGMGPRAQEVLRLIRASRIRGPIVDEFLKVQKDQGDDVAFSYLSAEADGLHVTPYGFCVNSFTVDPCPKNLECFNGCRHLTRSPVPEERQNLERLKDRMISVIGLIEAAPPEAQKIGWHNQLMHAQVRLENIEKTLAAEPGNKPFTDGPDFYRSIADKRGTNILDTNPSVWRPE